MILDPMLVKAFLTADCAAAVRCRPPARRTVASRASEQRSAFSRAVGLLAPGPFIDSGSEPVRAFAHRAVGTLSDPIGKAVRLFEAVRDGIWYNPFTVSRTRRPTASAVAIPTPGIGPMRSIDRSGLQPVRRRRHTEPTPPLRRSRRRPLLGVRLHRIR
jgi:hypothetical protein